MQRCWDINELSLTMFLFFSRPPGGNEGGLFAMDVDSGQVKVTAELTEAREYRLTVRVTNNEAPEYFADGTVITVLL